MGGTEGVQECVLEMKVLQSKVNDLNGSLRCALDRIAVLEHLVKSLTSTIGFPNEQHSPQPVGGQNNSSFTPSEISRTPTSTGFSAFDHPPRTSVKRKDSDAEERQSKKARLDEEDLAAYKKNIVALSLSMGGPHQVEESESFIRHERKVILSELIRTLTALQGGNADCWVRRKDVYDRIVGNWPASRSVDQILRNAHLFLSVEERGGNDATTDAMMRLTNFETPWDPYLRRMKRDRASTAADQSLALRRTIHSPNRPFLPKGYAGPVLRPSDVKCLVEVLLQYGVLVEHHGTSRCLQTSNIVTRIADNDRKWVQDRECAPFKRFCEKANGVANLWLDSRDGAKNVLWLADVHNPFRDKHETDKFFARHPHLKPSSTGAASVLAVRQLDAYHHLGASKTVGTIGQSRQGVQLPPTWYTEVTYAPRSREDNYETVPPSLESAIKADALGGRTSVSVDHSTRAWEGSNRAARADNSVTRETGDKRTRTAHPSEKRVGSNTEVGCSLSCSDFTDEHTLSVREEGEVESDCEVVKKDRTRVETIILSP